ncbi:hypothetical protein JCM17844_26550 [Iodidimonas gelatinilytica]|uniref:Uncharacterized protein n=1 Tax=Iodidimonas gelatinilytica TaxID=1236966 RepID=A0A5A7MVF9_9PROT|nr:hypothetical protein [Iodidimonas gelatinilytica]GEQ99018.1 hypothetical protein JCM17844_26550 [Iodidimonas gelatinilytica]
MGTGAPCQWPAGDLLGFLNTRIDHKADWQADETFIAAQKALRLDEKEPDTRQALVERANMAVIMGGGFLHMSMAQIFVNFGFEPDGTRPKPNPYGVLSPIDPVTCHEGGISCRQSTIPN